MLAVETPSEERRDVEDEVAEDRIDIEIVTECTGEVEIAAEAGEGLAADGAKGVDDKGDIVAAAFGQDSGDVGDCGEIRQVAREVEVGGGRGGTEASFGQGVVADRAGRVTAAEEAGEGKAVVAGAAGRVKAAGE